MINVFSQILFCYYIASPPSTCPFIWPNLKDALVCKFGTYYPMQCLWTNEGCLWGMGMVRSHYFATPSSIQNSMVLDLNNLSFLSPRMLCTKIVSYIGQVVLKKRTRINLKTLRQRQTKRKWIVKFEKAFELLVQMKWLRIKERNIFFWKKNHSL